ncbi:MAG TPA: glycogen synthase GlgA [Acidobacteriota bacterium]|jgi:starch synthase|nr:glycogen synthase GlgA [Acidobacteriota bacterium]
MAENLRVLIAAAEAAPFAKDGGLADVIGALPRELCHLGMDARVIIPRYASLTHAGLLRPKTSLGRISLEVYRFESRLWESALPDSTVPIYFVENNDFFGRNGIYNDPISGEGFSDNFQRFLYFTKAVFVACERIDWIPQVIHCNDSQTALIPAYLKLRLAGHPHWGRTASLFTIHNLGYQGQVGMDLFKLTDLPRHLIYPTGPFEFYGNLNPMKAGIVFADVLNTVSPTYAREIQHDDRLGVGLQAVLRSRTRDLHGILNGIDDEEWNPETDPLISAPFSVSRLAGKAKNKEELQRAFNLDERADVPLIGFIGRLAEQKGLDLVLESIPEFVAMDLQFVLLGSGQRKYHDAFQAVATRYPHMFGVAFSFDDKLAHWIEAGSDIFLMPSRYEPCGLNQMYSLRYGTVPVVRDTGGLADTVRDCHRDPDGNGFKFYTYSSHEMLAALRRALFAFKKRTEWRKIMKRGMTEDFSWRKSAQRYSELYRLAAEKR